jgi:hypothetical protein
VRTAFPYFVHAVIFGVWNVGQQNVQYAQKLYLFQVVARCDLLRTVFQLCQADDSSEKVPFFKFIYLFLHFNALEVIDM